MNNRISMLVSAVLVVVLTTITTQAQNLITSFNVEGDWTVGNSWHGVVIADLEDDGGAKEFIFCLIKDASNLQHIRKLVLVR